MDQVDGISINVSSLDQFCSSSLFRRVIYSPRAATYGVCFARVLRIFFLLFLLVGPLCTLYVTDMGSANR